MDDAFQNSKNNGYGSYLPEVPTKMKPSQEQMVIRKLLLNLHYYIVVIGVARVPMNQGNPNYPLKLPPRNKG